MGSAKLEELIERVKAATGPDREIDGAISAALKLGGNLPDWAENWAGEWKPTIQGSVVLMHGDGTPGPHFSAPSFTYSIDAIVALIEANGFTWLRKSETAMTVYRPLSEAQEDMKEWAKHFDAAGPNLPLALCLAFLQALSGDPS